MIVIHVMRKPVAQGDTTAGSVLDKGTGAINIDATRVGDSGGTKSTGAPNFLNQVYGNGMGGLKIVPVDGLGRWPSNLLLSHTPTCGWGGCSPHCVIEKLNAMDEEGAARFFKQFGSVPKSQEDDS